jgi:CheY-like chemotaxis protein
VLVLESDRAIRSLVSEWLGMAGYGFMDGRELGMSSGIAKCDVVLVDVRAPLQSARETIEGLALAMPYASIIAMSADALANGRSALEAVARELGVAAVLVKPFDRVALMQVLEAARASA